MKLIVAFLFMGFMSYTAQSLLSDILNPTVCLMCCGPPPCCNCCGMDWLCNQSTLGVALKSSQKRQMADILNGGQLNLCLTCCGPPPCCSTCGT
ncbi:hypothetical protein BpHYR1_054125 [Brachionus plicatilis]|uniref:Uncharacterized protein n=1 Tax=Brachionus plicatilis TaxID=10195 RepID=A0A3M7SMD6_BRAPC|nr:hypothetical protein BpHYR1_054125 [Brachionus plicatilis]